MIHPFYKVNRNSELLHWFFNNELSKTEKKSIFVFVFGPKKTNRQKVDVLPL